MPLTSIKLSMREYEKCKTHQWYVDNYLEHQFSKKTFQRSPRGIMDYVMK